MAVTRLGGIRRGGEASREDEAHGRRTRTGHREDWGQFGEGEYRLSLVWGAPERELEGESGSRWCMRGSGGRGCGTRSQVLDNIWAWRVHGLRGRLCGLSWGGPEVRDMGGPTLPRDSLTPTPHFRPQDDSRKGKAEDLTHPVAKLMS